MAALLETEQLRRLQQKKRKTMICFTASAVLAAFLYALRLVPQGNDRLSGRPKYAQAMAILTAQEIARATQNSVPVIVLEDDRCEPLRATGITSDDIGANLYVITWSEREHSNCITACALPSDNSKFADPLTIHAGEGWTAGPKLMRSVQVFPVTRQVRVFPPQYLQLLHWRARPWHPITENETARLAPHSYTFQSDPSLRPDAHAGLTLDFGQARALVREPHDRMNFRLSLFLLILSFASLSFAFGLVVLYKKAARYEWISGPLTFHAFLFHDFHSEEAAAREQHREQQQELVREKQRDESLRAWRQELEIDLHSALDSLHDADLRRRIEDYLAVESADLDRLEQLWEEVLKDSTQRTPEERLAELLESLKPYCTQEELKSSANEALSMLKKSGFRTASPHFSPELM